MALYFKEQNGTLIKRYSSTEKEDKLEIKKGGNTFVWDTRYKGAEILDGMIFWSASFKGSKAVPGNYKVILEKNGISQEQFFKILPDPRSEATLSDMKKQFDFVNLVNASADKAHRAIKNIRIIRKKLEDFEVVYKENITLNSLLKKAEKLNQSLTKIEKALYQTQNKSNQDPLNFPIRLTNKLGHLNQLVTINDFPPTDQDEIVRKLLTKKIDENLEEYEKLIKEDLRLFNENFSKLNLDYLTINEN